MSFRMLAAGADLLDARALAREAPSAVDTSIVFVAHDLQRSQEGLRSIESCLSHNFTTRVPMVIVANSTNTWNCLRNVTDRWSVIRGSNAEAEFSGYDEGTQHLLTESDPGSIYLLNDRAFSYNPLNAKLIRPSIARACADRRWVAGMVDTLPALGENDERQYLRSNFLCLPRSAWDEIGSWRVETASLPLPSAFPGKTWWDGRTIDPAYAAFLTRWLTGSGESGSWYKAKELDGESWPELSAKIRSIVYEHSLSLRLTEIDYFLVNAQRLGVALATDRAAEEIASWRQLPREKKLYHRIRQWLGLVSPKPRSSTIAP